MKLLFMIGNSAVGKMTVGQELMKITELRLFHNHMMIEPVVEIFGSFRRSTIKRLREIIIEDFAASDCYGMILTCMWDFNEKSSWDFAESICDIFKKSNADVDIYYVELVAPQAVRLQRNNTENRLKHKPSKRDIDNSNYWFFEADNNHRFVSNDGEMTFENYIKIENTNLAPDVVAKMIKEHFAL